MNLIYDIRMDKKTEEKIKEIRSKMLLCVARQ